MGFTLKEEEPVEEEEKEEEGFVDMKKVGIELDEWIIETDQENEDVSKVYVRETKKIKNKKTT
jgi:hypothetical protein